MTGNLTDVLELDRIGVTVVSVRESWLDTGGPVRSWRSSCKWPARTRWGAGRRIANGLAKLRHEVGKDAVSEYMPRPAKLPPRPPLQTWGTIIRTHAGGTIAIDFFTVPTVTFGVLCAFFVVGGVRMGRRAIDVAEFGRPGTIGSWWTGEIATA